jgi:hypothetical protein
MRTMVRVKRNRDRASASSLVLEIEPSTRGGGGRDGVGGRDGANGNEDEDDARAAMRRRASALASALDAVLEGGSAATPYGADAGGEARVPRGKRRKRCARVAAGVTRGGDDGATDEDAFPEEGGRKRERADVDADVYGAAKRLALGGEGGRAYRVVDVLVDSNGDAHAGEEDIKRAEEAEAVLMCNYAPMVREYLAKTTGEVPEGLGETKAKDAGDDWVYDVYVMDDDDVEDDDDDEGDETTQVIRVKDLSDAFDWEETVESDYGDSDSNAEDYFENDYPDTEETESERGWSDDSFDSDDGERRMDDYY